jgi:hypothetical protein
MPLDKLISKMGFSPKIMTIGVKAPVRLRFFTVA